MIFRRSSRCAIFTNGVRPEIAHGVHSEVERRFGPNTIVSIF